jgi:predicted  nucleic acid-binding Zn-ribbon protein
LNPDLERLVILQAQDLELKRLREELAEAPRRVAAAEKSLREAEAALEHAKQSLLKEEKLRGGQELDIADRKTKITRLQKQMETAANAAQISALEHEISFAEQTIAKLEDEELISLERTDASVAARAHAEEAVTATTSVLAAERERSASLTERHNASILSIGDERTNLRAEFTSDAAEAILSNYDRISKAKGTAVSEALDHKCSACQMVVRPQRWNDLTGREHDHVIFNCETCGRMLFYDPRRDRPVRWILGERLAATKADA